MDKSMQDFPYTKEQLTWLEALESGKYKQCTSYLKTFYPGNAASYCCLGVATELFDPDNPYIKRAKGVEVSTRSYLPEKMVKLLKLRDCCGAPVYVGNENFQTLTELNDAGYSFKRIAEKIRENPKVYFTNLDEKKLL